MFLNFIFFVNFFNILLQECAAARILVFIPLPFYSHQSVYKPLWNELANRGHKITLLTLNPMQPHENITQIDLSAVYTRLEKAKFFDVLSSGEQSLENVLHVFDTVLEAADEELSHPEVKGLIAGNQSFDLVITEYYLTVGAAFAHKFQCPFIGVVSMDAASDVHNIIGNPTHPILYPALDLGFSGELNLKLRLGRTLFYLAWNAYVTYSIRPRENELIQKHFGSEFPLVENLNKMASLLFINVNPVFHIQRPLNAQTINVGGGLHIQPPKSLPEDIQGFLDDAQHGAIYFSLGSSIRSSQLPGSTKSAIIQTFGQLPYTFLWKYEKELNDSMEVPKNVHLSNWLPQQDILRHKNIKLFITQGGLQSLEESLFIGVPVLVLPFYGDQISNAQMVVEHGFGLALDRRNVTVRNFMSAILKLITSTKYRNTALKLGKQISDQPWTPLEKAVWWTEFAIRNPKVDFLKHPIASTLPLYQYYFLDFLFVFLALFSVVCCVIFCGFVVYVHLLGRCGRTKVKMG
ncbi:hypothetical protein HUJ04_003376 [Dendroctonus ponderosae]|uniref:UDP-glucuronosyltransferase n=1 Tax=Dendroctonus ponderosae TaxID=77166 RepID=A0AAR5QC83_DENPD|nr:hypothetical protein HUJ04_003376 [Dendroctonus ponderosae]KAH1003453.1 hypothetical protein HUJ04_003376 [Dendroctonus ponderosae]